MRRAGANPRRSRVQCEAKRKLVAQPEISHEAAEAILRRQAPRTNKKFPGIIHVSHQLALLHGHENVFFCTHCGAFNACGSLRLLKSLCHGSGESRQKARRKLERGLMPNEHVVAGCDARILSGFIFPDVDPLCIVNIISHSKKKKSAPLHNPFCHHAKRGRRTQAHWQETQNRNC